MALSPSNHIVCLFGEFFTHMETSPVPVKGSIFWHKLGTPGHLSSRGCLACHTYCDTGHPFIMVISEDPWHSHLLPSGWQWSCHYLFLQLWSATAEIWTTNSGFRWRIASRGQSWKLQHFTTDYDLLQVAAALWLLYCVTAWNPI